MTQCYLCADIDPYAYLKCQCSPLCPRGNICGYTIVDCKNPISDDEYKKLRAEKRGY